MTKYIALLAFLLWSCGTSIGNELPEINDGSQTVSKPDTVAEPNSSNTNDSLNPSPTNTSYQLYIGTYTNKSSEGIYLASFDSDSGILSVLNLAVKLDNPSFQCITPDQEQLWSVSELWNGPGKIAGFAIDSIDGKLVKLAEFPTMGNGPCYVSYHGPSNTILAANYNSGNVVRIGVGTNNYGQTAIHQHAGKGPNKNRQSSPHAHNIHIAPEGQYAYACDLGSDEVYVYDLSKEGLQVKHIINTTKGAGPRHLAFHPEGKAMTVINELNSTLETYLPDDDGIFSKLHSKVSTIPDTFTQNNQCADIHYSANGKFLYASNRGHNSIAVFSIDQKSLKPVLIQWMEEVINWPRNIAISPDGRYLLAANQEGNQIGVYAIENETGLLTYTGNTLSISQPVCLTFLNQ